MTNHAPEDYICPCCQICHDGESNAIVHRDETATAFMRWHDSPGHLGHVLVVPNEHYENIFDLPAPVAAKIHECARVVALATKSAYRCDGVTLRRNNEPQGGQDVWHSHLHIDPRYEGDSFPRVDKVLAPAESRVEHAGQLRAHMVNHA